MIEYKKESMTDAQMSRNWPDCFYAALKPAERRQILQEHMAGSSEKLPQHMEGAAPAEGVGQSASDRKEMSAESVAAAAENEILLRLFDLRYQSEGQGKKAMLVDLYMRTWLDMSISAQRGIGFFGAGGVKKKWQKFMQAFGIGDERFAGEQEHALLLAEWKAFFAQYIALCRKDKSYNSVIMHMGQMKETDLAEKMAAELELVTEGFPEKLGLKEEFAEFHGCAAEMFGEAFLENRV